MKKIIVLLLGIVLVVNLNAQNWRHYYYVDEFGDKTNRDFLQYDYKDGSFNNSATTNSECGLYLEITKEYVNFKLYEYLEEPSVGKQIGDCTYELFMKIEKNNELMGGIKSYKLYTTNRSLIIYDDNDDYGDYESFINILKKSVNPIKCYILIENNEYNSLNSKYNFVINPIGFTKAYEKL